MLLEKNERTISASDSGGSDGSDSGSERIGSGGSGSGSGGSVDGSGGSVDGSGGSVDGSGGSNGSEIRSGNGSAELSGNDGSNESNVIGNQNSTVRESRIARERNVRRIRLGERRSGDRNTDADDNGRATRSYSDSEQFSSTDSVRLGSRKQGRPRKIENVESGAPVKLSDVKDLISVFIGSLFEIPAAALKQDFWRLSKDENKALTDALIQYLDSMPKSKSSKVATFISENLPLLNLVMVAFFIVSERAKQSIAISKVTRAGKAFEAAIKTAPANDKVNITTPLDSVFSPTIQ